MAGTKKMHVKKKLGKRGKKGKRVNQKTPDISQPGYPYGADRWVEAQPVVLPELQPGHLRTIFPVGLIMPTSTMDAAVINRQKIVDSDDKAATESLVWEEKLQELKLRLQDVTQSRYRYHNTNRFLENLLYTNEKNFLAAIDTLKHQESVLNVELTRVEDMYKETLTEKQNRQRAVDATHHESVNALEKEVAARDKRTEELVNDHLELGRLEEERDSLQFSITELRKKVYESEKAHQKAMMEAEQLRIITQRKTQDETQSKLEALAKKGTNAALKNIEKQTKQITQETMHKSNLFRWICSSVRKKLAEVADLEQLLENSVLDNDAVASACDAKFREYQRSKVRLQSLQQLVPDAEMKNRTAISVLDADSKNVFKAIEHAFYDRDKEILRLEAAAEMLAKELTDMKSISQQNSHHRNLIERFLMSSLSEARRNRQRYKSESAAREAKTYEAQLRLAWVKRHEYPPFRLGRTMKVNKSLVSFLPIKIPFHADISQLTWDEKEIVVEILLQYLCEYQTFGTLRPNTSGLPRKVRARN